VTSPASEQPIDELLTLAVRAARLAGEELLRREGNVQGLDFKSSATDPVTDADRASERLLVDTLLGARPGDAVLGEEGSDRSGTSGVRWIVDPLDGTVNYLYGRRGWSVSVAAEDEHGLLLGIVHDPSHGETFSAARGQGAWLGERRLQVNDPVELEQALVSTGFSYDAELRRQQSRVAAALAPRIRDFRRVGSAALDLCEVACGHADGFFENDLGVWDRAAGTVVAREAGAVVSDLPAADDPKGRTGVICAGPHLHKALRRALLG
jgi:myo-inositol-1(or 4)-monophosphatase